MIYLSQYDDIRTRIKLAQYNESVRVTWDSSFMKGQMRHRNDNSFPGPGIPGRGNAICP